MYYMGGNPSKVGSEQSPAIGPSPENGGKKKSLLHEGEGVSAPGVATSSRLHEGPIHSLCPLGQGSILSGGVDKDVNLYCWKQNYLEASFHGPVKDVTKICYNNTSNFVYAASRDRSLYGWKWPCEGEEASSHSESKCWPTHLSEPHTVLQGHSLGVTAMDTSDVYPQLLCSGSRDNSVCLWDLDVGKPVSSMHAPRNLVTDIKWILDEKSVVQASEDKTLRVWDLTSCSTVQHFRAKNYLQTCCDVSSSRQQFLSGSSGSGHMHGGELSLWDRRNEKKPLREFIGHSESVESCMFVHHDNIELVCSVGRDATIRLWELDSGQELTCQLLSGSGSLTDITSPERGLLACSSFHGRVSIFTLAPPPDDASSTSLILRSNYE